MNQSAQQMTAKAPESVDSSLAREAAVAQLQWLRVVRALATGSAAGAPTAASAESALSVQVHRDPFGFALAGGLRVFPASAVCETEVLRQAFAESA